MSSGALAYGRASRFGGGPGGCGAAGAGTAALAPTASPRDQREQPSAPSIMATPPRRMNIAIASISTSRSGRHRFAWMPVEAGSGSSSCCLIERRPLLVEGGVVAVDVAQIAGGAHDVLPRGALGREQSGDVVERAPRLRAEIAGVDASRRSRRCWPCRRSAGSRGRSDRGAGRAKTSWGAA